jgi:hypothetical protein
LRFGRRSLGLGRLRWALLTWGMLAMLRPLLPVAVMTARLMTALLAVALPGLWVLRTRRILEFTERVAEGLDLPLVGTLLDLDVIEHF